MGQSKSKRPVAETEKSSADVNMSLRLEGPMYERLRQLAFDRRQPMRDFIVQGIEMMLQAEKY